MDEFALIDLLGFVRSLGTRLAALMDTGGLQQVGLDAQCGIGLSEQAVQEVLVAKGFF